MIRLQTKSYLKATHSGLVQSLNGIVREVFNPHGSKCCDFNDRGKVSQLLPKILKRGLTSASATDATSFLLLLLLHPTTATAFGDHFFFHHVDDLIRNAQVFDGAATDVTFRHPPEFVSILSKKIHEEEG